MWSGSVRRAVAVLFVFGFGSALAIVYLLQSDYFHLYRLRSRDPTLGSLPISKPVVFKTTVHRTASAPSSSTKPKVPTVPKHVPAPRTEITTVVTIPAKPTRRPRGCHRCMEHTFKILLQPKACDPKTTLDIVFVVISAPPNTDRRNAIRQSWGKPKGAGLVKLVFLFGSPKSQGYADQLKRESEEYGDILQEDFHDAYEFLTYKTMMAFKWVKHNCQNVKYVFKTDDDMWVNVAAFLAKVKTIDMRNHIGGMCLLDAAPIRDRRSKWYASVNQYPQSKYPGFCTGTAYFMTSDTAVKIYDVSPNVPFFHLENIYVSLCAERLGVKLKPVRYFHDKRVLWLYWCQYKRRTLITSHGVSVAELLTLEAKKCN